MSTEYQYEEFVRPPGFETGFEGFAPLKTQLVPIALTVFPADYLSLRLATTYIDQSGTLRPRFSSNQFAVGGTFWVTDVGLAYRFPGRLGQLTVGVANLFDEKLLGYQDTDQSNPLFTRGRFAFAKVSIQFW